MNTTALAASADDLAPGFPGVLFGSSHDGFPVALVGDNAFAMVPGTNGRHYLATGWRIARARSKNGRGRTFMAIRANWPTRLRSVPASKKTRCTSSSVGHSTDVRYRREHIRHGERRRAPPFMPMVSPSTRRPAMAASISPRSATRRCIRCCAPAMRGTKRTAIGRPWLMLSRNSSLISKEPARSPRSATGIPQRGKPSTARCWNPANRRRRTNASSTDVMR